MAPGIDISLIRHDKTISHVTNGFSETPEVNTIKLLPSPTDFNEVARKTHALVLDPELITQEIDCLRFESAAFGQLSALDTNTPLPTDLTTKGNDLRPSAPPTYSTFLISSPYNNLGHYLDLSELLTPSLLFAKALTALQPLRSDYATAPYTEALNFSAVLTVLRDLCAKSETEWQTTSFYVVVFRSRLHPGIDTDWLYQLDYESHREACASGGLLKYWFGKTNADNENLATCFWHTREDAHKGGLGPWHKKARAAGRELYEEIVFSTHRFTILDGARGFRFGDWRECAG